MVKKKKKRLSEDEEEERPLKKVRSVSVAMLVGVPASWQSNSSCIFLLYSYFRYLLLPLTRNIPERFQKPPQKPPPKKRPPTAKARRPLIDEVCLFLARFTHILLALFSLSLWSTRFHRNQDDPDLVVDDDEVEEEEFHEEDDEPSAVSSEESFDSEEEGDEEEEDEDEEVESEEESFKQKKTKKVQSGKQKKPTPRVRSLSSDNFYISCDVVVLSVLIDAGG